MQKNYRENNIVKDICIQNERHWSCNDYMFNSMMGGIIKEPIGGAHHHPDKVYEKVRKCINSTIEELIKNSPDKMIKDRIKKFSKMGIYSG